MGESSHTFFEKQTNKLFYLGKTKQKNPWKWFVTRMMFTIHQKRFSVLKKTFISFFTNGANRPGVNRPVRKMVLERIVPGGTGFGANRPLTHIYIVQLGLTGVHIFLIFALTCVHNLFLRKNKKHRTKHFN